MALRGPIMPTLRVRLNGLRDGGLSGAKSTGSLQVTGFAAAVLVGLSVICPREPRFMVVTPQLLKTFPLLSGLPDATLAELAEQSSVRKAARRSIVLNAGQNEDQICFLFEGRLQGVDFTIDGREVGLYFVEPGEYCGELYLFDGGTLPEFVMALTPSVIVSVPLNAMQALLAKHPELFATLSAKVAGHVRKMTFQRSLLGLPNIAQRVCCQLWMLVPEQDKEKEEALIRNPPTHMEIAIMLNISRETVTRVFQSLQNRQVVKREGTTALVVSKVAELRDFAEGKQEL